VPLFALNQIPRERADWLVPGMLKEKVQLLLKSLPQKLRRHCVPLPEYAANFFDRNQDPVRFGRGDLIDALILDIHAHTSARVLTTDFKLETLPAHLFMNFKVVDEHGRQLDMGRNLASLQAELGGQARQSFQRMAEAPAGERAHAGGVRRQGGAGDREAGGSARRQRERQGHRRPRSRRRRPSASIPTSPAGASASCRNCWRSSQGKLTLIGFPALVDKGTTATWKCSTTPTWRRAPTASACAACSRCSSRSS
jgi:ATP-dependent helicase HrpA